MYSDKSCLVIDDFPEIRGSLTRTLRNFGIQTVDTAADGEEAVRLCSKNKYDIVICDYNLGAGKDGQQVLEEVRYLRVLLMTSLFMMLTGESSREMVLGALECQPDDYITKPYTEGSLRTRLNRAMLRHVALIDIKKAISDGDYNAALEGCNQMIHMGSRYAPDCVKMKGHLLFLLRQLKEAQELYESVLDKKPIVWAKLGLGKSLLEMGKLDAAAQMFEEVIEEDNRYIEAHDLMAEVYTAKHDTIKAQKAVERAAQISPKSVHRHRKLAELADTNGDSLVAMKCHQQAIKYGQDSCHESSQDYFNYARKVSDVVREGLAPNDQKVMVKKAVTYLDRARKRYGNTAEIAAQSQMVEAQLYQSQGDTEKAKAATEKAKSLYKELQNPPVETSVEFARTLHTMNEEEQARAILNAIAADHPDDKRLMSVIDGITSEPISDKGKKIASQLTKTGIGSYDSKDFDAAIEVFNKAINVYPKHTGLNLNLIQAVIAATERSGPNPEYEQLCRRSLSAVGDIPPDRKQFKRYEFLQKQLGKHYPGLIG